MCRKKLAQMKKLLLLIALLFQLIFVFGQENAWGPWNNSDCYPRIQFRAKLVSKQYYNGGSTSSDGCDSGLGYQWKVQVRNNYSKTAWVYFSAGNKSCVEKSINDGDGLNLDPNEVGEISLKDWYSNNIEGIYVLIKSMAFLESKNDDSYKNDSTLQYEKCDNGGLCQICIIDMSANHCPEVKTSKKVKINDNSSSNPLKIEEIENQIITNLKQNLKIGEYGNSNYGITNIQQIDVIRDPSTYYLGEGEPHTLYIYFYVPGQSNLFGDKFANLRIEKISRYGKDLLYLKNSVPNNLDGLFIYDFGANNENYTELKNAIEVLKNPNKNLNEASEQNNPAQKDNSVNNVAEQEKNKNVLTEEKRVEEINNNYKLGLEAYNAQKYKDAETYFQKVLDLNPNDEASYSNLISVKLVLDKIITEEGNKNRLDHTIFNKHLRAKITLLKQIKLLLEKYKEINNRNADFNNYLEEINKYLTARDSNNPNAISPQDLLNSLKNKTTDKLNIFKDFFIQEGYEFIVNEVCKNSFEIGNLKCLKFSNFSIYQNKKGMCGISFGSNEKLMNEIKDKLTLIDDCFINNELYINKTKSDYYITFNQGELLFYMK